MAVTTTDKNACSAGIWLDNAAGTPVDISGSSTSFDYTFTQELGDWQAFQNKWRQRLECGKDGAFTLNVVYSTTATEGYQIINTWFFTDNPGARTLTWYVPDKNVGSNKYQAEVRLQSMSVTLDPSDAGPIILTAELLPDGEITHSTAAT